MKNKDICVHERGIENDKMTIKMCTRVGSCECDDSECCSKK